MLNKYADTIQRKSLNEGRWIIIKPTVLVVGTSHFSNQNHGNMFMTETEGILTEGRQNEISEVVHSLKKFNPTKVALEVLPSYEKRLNQDYLSYKKGDFSLLSNESESYQIGFRLAKESNLDKVYAVDWNDDSDGIPDFKGLANEYRQSKIFNGIEERLQELTTEEEEYYQHHTIREYLLLLNDKDYVAKDHEDYMKQALIGDKDNPVGIEWTINYWYYRNMIIYKNLINLIESKEERIFVLYGAGHLHLVMQFLKESGLCKVQVASDYLK